MIELSGFGRYRYICGGCGKLHGRWMFRYWDALGSAEFIREYWTFFFFNFVNFRITMPVAVIADSCRHNVNTNELARSLFIHLLTVGTNDRFYTHRLYTPPVHTHTHALKLGHRKLLPTYPWFSMHVSS